MSRHSDDPVVVVKQRKKTGTPREKNPDSKYVCTYTYTDLRGRPWMKKVRFEPGYWFDKDGNPTKKSFFVEHRVSIKTKRPKKGLTGRTIESWRTGAPPDTQNGYIYRVVDVREAMKRHELIFLVDGEKDADTLWEHGHAATCTYAGNGQEFPRYALKQLSGANVVIIVDRDEDFFGAYESRKRARSLCGQVVAFFEAAIGKDATDHFAAGLGLGEMNVLEYEEVERRSDVYAERRRELKRNGRGDNPAGHKRASEEEA